MGDRVGPRARPLSNHGRISTRAWKHLTPKAKSQHVTNMPNNTTPATQDFQRAVALHDQGRLAEATSLYERIVSQQPQHFEAVHRLGVLAYQMGNFAKAAELMAESARLAPDNPAFHSNHGLAQYNLGNLEAALASFDRAIAIQPTFLDAFVNRGNVLEALGRPADAVAAYDQAGALQPTYYEAHFKCGNALHGLNRFEAAISAFSRAIAVNGSIAAAYVGRGSAYQELGMLTEALADFDHALTLEKTSAFIYRGRGRLYKDLGRRDEALADFSQALALAPNDLRVKKDFFWLHVQKVTDIDLVERLSDDLARQEAAIDAEKLRSDKHVQNFRLLHDLEQASYLSRQGYAVPDLAKAESTLQAISDRVKGAHVGDNREFLVSLSADETETLTRFRKTAVRYGPTLPRDGLNPHNDWAEIERRYLEGRPEVVVIDNFLSPEALEQLRTFCLASMVWRCSYSNGYMGAFSEKGFMSPLHLQIEGELRRALPRIIGDHYLEQVWAFKYASKTEKGINVHADFARVNLNFWITPDDANLDPSSGGMEIYDVPAPQDWDFGDYNGSTDRIFAFLKEHNAGNKTVPYRCNRAVLFNSSLFHRTSDIRFKEGYENRRINVTYLFGVGLKIV